MKKTRNLVAAACVVALAGSLTACKKKPAAEQGGASSLSLVPKDTGVVASINVAKLRTSKPWAKIEKLRDMDPDSKKEYEAFVAGTGFDPLKDLSSMLVAVPQGANKQDKEFAMIVQSGKKLDEKKLIDYAKAEAQKKGDAEVKSEQYGGKTLYGSSRNDESWAVFLAQDLIAVAGKETIKKVVDLHAGKGESAEKNAPLMALTKRADTSAAIWAVGMVPNELQGQIAPGSSIASMVGSVDLTSGLVGKVELETGSVDEAKKLAELATAQVGQAKNDPMMAMTGIAPMMEKVKVAAEGKTFKVDITLTQQQFDEVMTKVEGMAKMFGGGMRKGGMEMGGERPATGDGSGTGHGTGTGGGKGQGGGEHSKSKDKEGKGAKKAEKGAGKAEKAEKK